jgi:peptidoglycan/xylan/chitin deacetylase (PgdA/CDA1 family)
MYHYVRDLPRTRFPKIKGLLTSDFAGQLDYIQRYYTVCNLEDVRAAVHGEDDLPANACLLTFDDGYADHFHTVFPMLLEREIHGSFFVPACLAEGGKVLQINKVHYILASTDDHAQIAKKILAQLELVTNDYGLPGGQELYARFSQQSRWDPPDTAFVKRVLQKGLPAEISSKIVEELFVEFVSVDEASLAAELYLNSDQLRLMVQGGMDIGGHGYSHRPLGNLSRMQQADEIEKTKLFLELVHEKPMHNWTLTYPNGSYNADTTDLLEASGCDLAMTTEVGLATLEAPLELRRLNTNDLPVVGNAEPVSWTVQALQDSD